MSTFIDAGWSGAPADVASGLAANGWQVEPSGSVLLVDPAKNTNGIAAVAGYRVLDGVAYVLLRSTQAVPLPAGVTAAGPDHTAAISGTFMSGTSPNTIVSSSDFLARFTSAEMAAVWKAAQAVPQIGVGLVQGLTGGGVDLSSAAVKAWMDALVTAGALTAARETTILTP